MKAQLIKNVFLLFFSMAACLSAQAVTELDESLNEAKANNEKSKASQSKIDELYDQKREALFELRGYQSQIDQLEVYNRQLREIIGNQEKQIDSLNTQIKEIEVTQQGIMPLMDRMLNGLEFFVSLDLPFLLSEREQRIASLRSLLLSSDVTVSEKFRRVLEAYQIEIEYGRTIETYREVNGDDITVDILRVGRSALYSITLDQQSAMVWNSQSKEWQALESAYLSAIKKGVSIAKKQSTPSLLVLPVQATGVNQ